MNKPAATPKIPHFSSGPTCKRPGWSVQALSDVPAGRSHRAKIGKAKLKEAADLSREVARIPDTHRVGILAGSDTGAFEAAMWSMLGQRPVTAVAWESFGAGWVTDITKQLKLDPKVVTAEYGELPDLNAIDWDTDVTFTFNGTTSGVRVPEGWSPPADRKGLAMCDATSAVFAMNIPWENLDVVTWSWQKCLGGEAAHGMMALSPRAVERLESYTPSWPLPKLFRLTKGGKLIEGVWEGSPINTTSMLAVEDYLDTLKWAKGLEYNGRQGLDALIARSEDNLKACQEFVAQNDWIDFLASKKETLSSTSICFKITADWFQKLSEDDQRAFCKEVVGLLDKEGAAYDCAPYRDAPPGFRYWGGPTVEPSDMKLGLEWLGWAYETIRQSR